MRGSAKQKENLEGEEREEEKKETQGTMSMTSF